MCLSVKTVCHNLSLHTHANKKTRSPERLVRLVRFPNIYVSQRICQTSLVSVRVRQFTKTPHCTGDSASTAARKDGVKVVLILVVVIARNHS